MLLWATASHTPMSVARDVDFHADLDADGLSSHIHTQPHNYSRSCHASSNVYGICTQPSHIPHHSHSKTSVASPLMLVLLLGQPRPPAVMTTCPLTSDWHLWGSISQCVQVNRGNRTGTVLLCPWVASCGYRFRAVMSGTLHCNNKPSSAVEPWHQPPCMFLHFLAHVSHFRRKPSLISSHACLTCVLGRTGSPAA